MKGFFYMAVINGVMLQFYHWYTTGDGSLWRSLSERAEDLHNAGFTAVWLPPAYKGIGGSHDVGYGVYDLFDLGEFDQKGSVRTKYGTKDDYLAAIRNAQEAGLQVYADIVTNHKMGADAEEEVEATPYNPDNRREPLGEARQIKAWTHFTFPGRNDQYSKLKWHWWHFNAVDYNALSSDKQAVYLFEGKQFDDQVDDEKGNFDYLMGCNLDMNNPDVEEELLNWGKWYLDTTGIDGFRFDAAKHVKADFFQHWLHQMQLHSRKKLFAVGEYWSGDREAQNRFIKQTEETLMLFDVNLHYNFSNASTKGSHYDLRRIFDNTLVQEKPDLAVTFVSNHDSQPLQDLASVVEPWFTPLAYALILLRKGGYPCVFAADYDGASYTDNDRQGQAHHIEMVSHQWLIDKFLYARRYYAYGKQLDFFQDPHCIGWMRAGNENHPCGLITVMSNKGEGAIEIKTPVPDTVFVDLTEHIKKEVKTDANGHASFPCPAGSLSVWIPADSPEN